MPAQRFAVAYPVDVILCVPMLFDMNILPGSHFEHIGLERTEKLAGDVLSLDAVGHVLLVARIHQVGADREPHFGRRVAEAPAEKAKKSAMERLLLRARIMDIERDSLWLEETQSSGLAGAFNHASNTMRPRGDVTGSISFAVMCLV